MADGTSDFFTTVTVYELDQPNSKKCKGYFNATNKNSLFT